MHYFVGTNGKSNYSLTLPCHLDSDQRIKPNLNVQEASDSSDSHEVDIIATQYERNLFSSSLSELFTKKCKFYLFLLMWRLSHLVE